MFKELFWKVFTEHVLVQAIMYVSLFLVTTLAFLHGGNEFDDSALYGLILPFGIKSLSALSSLFKAWFIIMMCKKGDSCFLKTYTEGTGKQFK